MRLIIASCLLFAVSMAQTDYKGYRRQECSGTPISTTPFPSNVVSECAALCNADATCEYFVTPYCATCPEEDEDRAENARFCTGECVTVSGDTKTWTTYQVDASGSGDCSLFTAAQCGSRTTNNAKTSYDKMLRSDADQSSCTNPAVSPAITESGCETFYPTRFCNFGSIAAVIGTCSLCPATLADPQRTICDDDWTEYKSWYSKLACGARCEEPNRTVEKKVVTSTWDTTTYGEIHPIYTPSHCNENPLTNALGQQVPTGITTGTNPRPTAAACCTAADPDGSNAANLCSGQYEYKYGDFDKVYTDACKLQTCVANEGNSGDAFHCSVILNDAMDGKPCTLPHVVDNDGADPLELPGQCHDGQCILTSEMECPPGQVVKIRGLNECNSGSTQQLVGTFSTSSCISTSANVCLEYGPGLGEFNAYVISPVLTGTPPEGTYRSNTATAHFLTQWRDALGRCVVGEVDSTSYHGSATTCMITVGGSYLYNGMDLTWVPPQEISYYNDQGATEQVRVTILVSELLMMKLTPRLFCKGNHCVADFDANWAGQKFCGADIPYCEDGTTTSHGDPIIWTFDNECYDLNQDGLYVASEARMFDHTIKVAVYNDYMRAIQVVNKKTGEIMLSMNTNGEVMNNNYPYYFKEEVKDCPEDMKKTECPDQYTQFEFDAQDFRYYVQVVRHDYADPGLKEGELGYHLDIYPKPYKKNWAKHKGYYTGLYFENPLPEELPYCPGGSPRTRSN